MTTLPKHIALAAIALCAIQPAVKAQSSAPPQSERRQELRTLVATLDEKFRGAEAMRAHFDRSQALWEQSLTAICNDAVYALYDQGSLAPVISSECATDMIDNRIVVLNTVFRSVLHN